MTDNQKIILKAMADRDGRVTAEVFHGLCAKSSRVEMALFRSGLVECDRVPATHVSITDKAKKALSGHEQTSHGGGGESRPAPHLVEEDEPTMGTPSDKRRSARRPGKQERARVKKRMTWGHGIQRGGHWSSEWGAGTETAYVGRKKMRGIINVARATWGGKPLPSIGESDELESRAKALGPHSERAGIASGPPCEVCS